MLLSSATRLGPYEILSPLGAGGMGEVWRARDTRLNRDVALKVPPAAISGDAERRQRFEQEARAASALNHPNIITVYDVGTADSTTYLAMEHVEGRTLRELIAAEPLAILKLLDVSVGVAEGLAKAHSAGIVHRDLKPENVMISQDGFVKILDFGLAKLTESLPQQDSAMPTVVGAPTAPGTVMGTVGYMSPEQASGHAVDFRSDQFSFGSILYEMATGKRAFQKATAVETLSAIILEEPEPVERANPRAPAPLRWIVERCLAKDPEERYASTRDLARDLRSIRNHLSEASVPGGTPAPGFAAALTPRSGRALRAALAAAALLAALAARMLLQRRLSRTPPPSYQQITFASGPTPAARFA